MDYYKTEYDECELTTDQILYDLTNTFLTGESPAKRGSSKQKRNDYPLLTLPQVLDEDGFPMAAVFSPAMPVSRPR